MKLSLLINSFSNKSTLLFLITFMSISTAFAMDLNTAKDQGLVGEGNNGYLGYVVPPASADVKTLVNDVNTKRKAIFETTAKKNNISTEQVANRFYERAVQATTAGRYYQNASGQWVKK